MKEVFVEQPLALPRSANHMVMKASRQIRLLRRMRQLGVEQQTIVSYWKAEGICHLEYCSPVYRSTLTRGTWSGFTSFHTRARSSPRTAGGWRRISAKEDIAWLRSLQSGWLTTQGTRTYSSGWTTPINTRSGGKSWRDPPCHTKRHFLSA